MDTDHTFRIILLAGFLILIPVGVYYRVRSQATREKLDRRQEGLFILLTLRPVGVAGMLGFIAYLIDPAWMAWSSLPLPEWLCWIGVTLGAAAGFLLIWSKNLTDTVVTRKEHTLVTSGPYRWVRHPFYLTLALAVIANSLAASNWFILITGSLAFTLIVLRTRREEEHLLGRFGDEYRTYTERTGRFLPRR